MAHSTGSAETKKSKRGATSYDRGAAMLRAQIKTLPAQPGVYRMIGHDGTPLYVGKAKDLSKRVASYTQRARLPVRLQRMVALAQNLEITVTRTETEALLLEANYIQKFLPPFNILLRDDKSYPYILITRPPAPRLRGASDHTLKSTKPDFEDFPQIAKHRGAKNRKGWYFGPFASGAAVTETLTLLQRGFMLRNCSDSYFANRSRPCLQYHIKRCTAPCVGKVGKEEYAKQTADAVDFLKGRNQDVQHKLATQMQAASDALDFETAARLRDRIKILTSIQAKQSIHVEGLRDADVIALHQNSGKTAVQVFFFREGRNYGARVFYPAHDKTDSAADIMAAFIAQFYAGKPAPSLLLLDRAPSDAELLAAALSEQAQHKVHITVPQAGDKKRLIDMAQHNAQESLARTMAERDEQVRLMNRVAEIFGMAAPPKRIEVYDNSHIQGSFAVGAMIAAGPEGFLKKTYRKFNIRHAQSNDDFGMMREVLTRRFQRLMTEDPERGTGLWPDLLLIDGGAGQLGKVAAVMDEMGVGDIAVVGIAKGPDRNAGRERFFVPGREPFTLPHDDPALYYLQRLRDEAHRFAIGTHRARRAKAIGQSRLDEVPGIGASRKRALLHHFGSAKAVEAADIEALTRAPGISRAVAQKIHDYFREGR
ncbi:MAG: excinuclease ABC subunit UvrC [Alphaproteobacteria bacterium]|nr:excinuclease ABC subunit UvrC [Alphaproteobacteria bacterium]